MKPKLTLRDLFWLVLVCAMGCGWWLDRSNIQRQLDWLTDEVYSRFGARYWEEGNRPRLVEEL